MSLNFKKIFIGALFSAILSFLLVCILTIFVFFMNIPDQTVSTLIFALSVVSVFFGALILGKTVLGGGLLHGFLMSLLYFGILSVLSLAISGKISFETSNLFRLLGAILAGILGGILGINSQKD